MRVGIGHGLPRVTAEVRHAAVANCYCEGIVIAIARVLSWVLPLCVLPYGIAKGIVVMNIA